MIRICRYGEISEEEIFLRSEPTVNVSGTVEAILKDVRERGDAALFDYTERFDGVRLGAL